MGLLAALSHSRQTFPSLFRDARMASFLQGRAEAFQAFGGVPRRLLHDNLKSAVVARRGKAVTFNPTLLALAAHCAFEPTAAWPNSPEEKGRVERRVGFARTGFFAGRDIAVPLGELSAAAREWCRRPRSAPPRSVPGRTTTAFRSGTPSPGRGLESLIALPADPFPHHEIRPARIDRTCHARFDTNDCSVPPGFSKALPTLVADRDEVRILDGTGEVARHRRSSGFSTTGSGPSPTRSMPGRSPRASGGQGR